MPHFLDALPFDLSSPPAQELWGLLADTYYRDTQAEMLIRQAGIRPATINFSGAMDLVWVDILVKSRSQNRLRPLLDVIADGADAAVAARIKELVAPEPPSAPPVTDAAGDLDWKGPPRGAADEIQILAESTLLDVAFLRRGSELAGSVCRLLVTSLAGKRFVGTGFRIAERLVLTNHHVLFDHSHRDAAPTAVEAWFDYERTFDGADLEHRVIAGVPTSIRGGKKDDWAVIELAASPPDDAAVIPLVGAPPPHPNDRVYIIQHPYGGPKQIGMVHNEVRYVDDDIVQYRTDTASGSSGSPVFDERWRLVALHHKYVTHRENGVCEYRNQGRRIERVAEALEAARIGD